MYLTYSSSMDIIFSFKGIVGLKATWIFQEQVLISLLNYEEINISKVTTTFWLQNDFFDGL